MMHKHKCFSARIDMQANLYPLLCNLTERANTKYTKHVLRLIIAACGCVPVLALQSFDLYGCNCSCTLSCLHVHSTVAISIFSHIRIVIVNSKHFILKRYFAHCDTLDAVLYCDTHLQYQYIAVSICIANHYWVALASRYVCY